MPDKPWPKGRKRRSESRKADPTHAAPTVPDGYSVSLDEKSAAALIIEHSP